MTAAWSDASGARGSRPGDHALRAFDGRRVGVVPPEIRRAPIVAYLVVGVLGPRCQAACGDQRLNQRGGPVGRQVQGLGSTGEGGGDGKIKGPGPSVGKVLVGKGIFRDLVLGAGPEFERFFRKISRLSGTSHRWGAI